MFNVGAFFVLFREALEAAIILGVLLRYLDKTITTNPHLLHKLKRQVWLGTLVGLTISVLIGAAFTAVFYLLKHDILGNHMPLFEGILQAIATLLLTWLAFKMLSVNNMYSKWEKKIAASTKPGNDNDEIAKENASSGYGFMLLTFSIVLREGLESVVFIAGIGTGEPQALLIPGLLGIIIGIGLGYAVYRGSKNLNLKLFFQISTVVLLIIAAGLAVNAASELEEYIYRQVINFGVEGAGEEEDEFENKETGGYEIIPEGSKILWDVSDCCSEKKNGFFQVMGTLTGWKSRPTVITTLIYFLYWIIIIILFIWQKIRNNRSEAKDLETEAKKNDLPTMQAQRINEERNNCSARSSFTTLRYPEKASEST